MKGVEMLYLWKNPTNECPNKLIGEYDDECSVDPLSLDEGISLPQSVTATVRFEVSLKRLYKLNDLPNTTMIPLVGPKIREVLLRMAPEECQFIDTRIIASDGETRDYMFLVVTAKVFGLDHEQSQYSFVHGTDAIMGFTKLRYLEGVLGDLHIARDKEYTSNLLISKELHDAFIEAGIRGVGFYRPEELFG